MKKCTPKQIERNDTRGIRSNVGPEENFKVIMINVLRERRDIIKSSK